ncbi:DUF4232 domain-containing protein [Streptomyces sp. NPDC042319]|uniref:DUF4232 domain-containing protein n=1 Tax=Streptomyces sp. NPDC042319 TaxID=3154332 RepID=UPI003410B16C
MRGLRTVVTAAAVAAMAAGGLAGAAAAAQASDAGAGACQPGTLKVTTTDAGQSQVGMNHAGTYLKVKNTGDETCAIKGYAGLALEGAGHKALNTEVRHGDTYFAKDPGAHTVTLKPGGVAYADLVWTHTGADPAPAKYLQVSPTGSNSHSVVPLEDDVDNGTLNLTAWSAELPTAG